MPRNVTLQLYASDGGPLGTLPPYEVEPGWWHHTAEVVDGARACHGIEVRVLRLVTGRPRPHPTYGDLPAYAGEVTYAAELIGSPGGVALGAPTGPADDHPLRAVWARPGGTDRILAAVDPLLAAAGRPRTGRARQARSWNLSSVLEIPTTAGPVWAKSVPPFFAHEGRVLAILDGVAPPGLLPRLVATDDATRTVVMDHVPGDDGYDADEETVSGMIDLLVETQAAAAPLVGDLLAAGAPDWRASALTTALTRLVARADVAATVSDDERAEVTALVGDLPRRLSALAACGIPDTLVHGDCHPGNWRVAGSALTLLDWGDAGVGHPLLDTAAGTLFFTDDAVRKRLLDRYAQAWARRLPRADAAAALSLVRPVAALRQALVYRTLCDGIEPAERVYHESDVGWWLRRAVAEQRAVGP